MLIYKFQDLSAWQKAHKLTLEVWRITQDFPKHELFGLVSQFRCSSVSICANLTESYRKSTRDFARYIQISQGSLEETKYYTILRQDLGCVNQIDFQNLFYMADEASRVLTGLRKQIAQRANNIN